MGLFSLSCAGYSALADTSIPSSNQPSSNQPSSNQPSSDIPPANIHWSYQNETGPAHWASLDTAFESCGSGQSQSPINVTATTSTDLVNPDFHYQAVPLNLLNNGHTVKVPYAPGSYMTLDGIRYNLLQFHFHSPSEHAVEGQLWDAELHLVHQNDVGALAVVAVLLKESKHPEGIQPEDAYNNIGQNLPNKAGDKIRTQTTINAHNLLPSQATTYRYTGSLTTPPCSESVTWLVMTDPVELPSAVLKRYRQLLNNNNRPLQRLNNRTVQMDISL
ncbi:MAG: carbonic anhydrase family protein [Cyanobacteria bacterium P01_D01_bin.105]